MESPRDGSSPLSPGDLGEEAVNSRESNWITTVGHGQFWLIDSAIRFKVTARNQRVVPVTILVKDGETWVVDSQSADQFKVAVHATPVTGQWRTTQFCGLDLGHSVNECSRYPYPECVLTCVDHGHAGACVVVVFAGWDHAEAFIRVTSPDRDLPDPKLLTITGMDGALLEVGVPRSGTWQHSALVADAHVALAPGGEVPEDPAVRGDLEAGETGELRVLEQAAMRSEDARSKQALVNHPADCPCWDTFPYDRFACPIYVHIITRLASSQEGSDA